MRITSLNLENLRRPWLADVNGRGSDDFLFCPAIAGKKADGFSGLLTVTHSPFYACKLPLWQNQLSRAAEQRTANRPRPGRNSSPIQDHGTYSLATATTAQPTTVYDR